MKHNIVFLPIKIPLSEHQRICHAEGNGERGLLVLLKDLRRERQEKGMNFARRQINRDIVRFDGRRATMKRGKNRYLKNRWRKEKEAKFFTKALFQHS